MINEKRYVSNKLLGIICYRMGETLNQWGNLFNSLIMPHPGSLPMMTDAKAFTDEEKEELRILLSKINEIKAHRTVLSLKKDLKGLAKFIDDTYNFVQKTFLPRTIEIMEKMRDNWKEEAKKS